MFGAESSQLPALLAIVLGAGGIGSLVTAYGNHRTAKAAGQLRKQQDSTEHLSVVQQGFVELVEGWQEAHAQCLRENEALRREVETLKANERTRDRRLEMLERDLGPSRRQQSPRQP